MCPSLSFLCTHQSTPLPTSPYHTGRPQLTQRLNFRSPISGVPLAPHQKTQPDIPQLCPGGQGGLMACSLIPFPSCPSSYYSPSPSDRRPYIPQLSYYLSVSGNPITPPCSPHVGTMFTCPWWQTGPSCSISAWLSSTGEPHHAH